MNNKIFNFLIKNLQDSFNLPKYNNIVINKETIVKDLPWTPKRYEKFVNNINETFDL